MKIKIVSAKSLQDLEDLVNGWIDREKVFDTYKHIHTDISHILKYNLLDSYGSKEYYDEYIGVIRYS